MRHVRLNDCGAHPLMLLPPLLLLLAFVRGRLDPGAHAAAAASAFSGPGAP